MALFVFLKPQSAFASAVTISQMPGILHMYSKIIPPSSPIPINIIFSLSLAILFPSLGTFHSFIAPDHSSSLSLRYIVYEFLFGSKTPHSEIFQGDTLLSIVVISENFEDLNHCLRHGNVNPQNIGKLLHGDKKIAEVFLKHPSVSGICPPSLSVFVGDFPKYFVEIISLVLVGSPKPVECVVHYTLMPQRL